MNTVEIKTLCLKKVYGVALTDAERGLVDNYAQTTDGSDYLRECREMKDLLKNVGDVEIKPVDHGTMVERFESTVRHKFNETVFRPWWEANSPPVILGLLAVFMTALSERHFVYEVLLGSCVLWLIADFFQRRYYAKVLSRPDLYEYAKASRRRSDRILQSLPGKALVTALTGLLIAVVSYATYWIHLEFGFVGSAIAIFVLVETVAIVGLQFRKVKYSNSEVWDWWKGEIKE